MENLTKNTFKRILQDTKTSTIYFDFDGTIVDSAQRKKRVFYDITNRNHWSSISTILKEYDGLNREQIITEICKLGEYNETQLSALFFNATEIIYQTCDAFTKFEEFRYEYDCDIKILSSSLSTQIEHWLNMTDNLKFVSDIVTPTSKKDYLKRHQKTILFGDGKQDLDCGDLAHVEVVYVSGWSDNFTDLRINTRYQIQYLEDLI